MFYFYSYRLDDEISIYMDHVGDGLDDLFDFEKEDDDIDSCNIVGGENEEDIGNLIDIGIKHTEEKIIMNKICNDEFLSKLCAHEEGDINNDEYDWGRGLKLNT